MRGKEKRRAGGDGGQINKKLVVEWAIALLVPASQHASLPSRSRSRSLDYSISRSLSPC